MAAADRLRESFPGGLAFMELAAVTDPVAVVPTIAHALGVKDAETRSLADGLATIIGDLRVLLVLDNLEQVIEAAPDLAALLRECPSLHLMTTSRAPLRITAEVEFPLRPLALPPPGEMPPLEDLETYPAVELFLDRTRRARAGFRVTSDNAPAVLQICRRLDGLPLALELAAARLRTLEPETLLERLEHALDVLTAGARDLPERQRTLRATIDWSHSLLDDVEQRLLRRLAVFAGGWTQDAVAPICYGDEDDRSLDAFESLVEKGLIQQVDDAGRFGMLETIREYATERLAAAGEEEATRRRHAEHFRRFVAQMYLEFRGTRQIESLQRSDAEATNTSEALACFYRAGLTGDAAAVGGGLSMCGDLWMHWHVRGQHMKAHAWSARFLELPSAQDFPILRARALATSAVASMTLGNVPRALATAAEARLLVEGSDNEVLVLVELTFGVANLTAGAFDEARGWLETAIRRAQAVDLPWERGIGLGFLGIVETASGNADVARSHFEEALPLQRALGDREGLGAVLGGLAALEAAAGSHRAALKLYQDAFDAYHEIGDRPEEARILDEHAWTALAIDRADEAREYFAASLRAYEEVGSVRGIGLALLGLAATHATEARPERAVRIAAAAAMFTEQEGVANDYARHTAAPRYLDAARAVLDPVVIARLEAEGRALSVREAVRAALDPADARSPQLAT